MELQDQIEATKKDNSDKAKEVESIREEMAKTAASYK